jgi:hypothetical protein
MAGALPHRHRNKVEGGDCHRRVYRRFAVIPGSGPLLSGAVFESYAIAQCALTLSLCSHDSGCGKSHPGQGGSEPRRRGADSGRNSTGTIRRLNLDMPRQARNALRDASLNRCLAQTGNMTV